MATLELENLTKQYPGVVSVDSISLAVEHGEFVCLLGPSGCGKTTTLRMIAGFIEPDAGQIRVGGKVVSSPGAVVPPERRNMSMIFQSYAVWPHMTVRQNVEYGLKMKSMPAAERDARTDALLATTKLSAQADRYPSELSGGQQQRVALARAMAPKPDILLLDEPLSNLDANLRGEMRFEIRRLHDEFHYTSIYVTHDQSRSDDDGGSHRHHERRAHRADRNAARRCTSAPTRSSLHASSAAAMFSMRRTWSGNKRRSRRPCARDR